MPNTHENQHKAVKNLSLVSQLRDLCRKEDIMVSFPALLNACLCKARECHGRFMICFCNPSWSFKWRIMNYWWSTKAWISNLHVVYWTTVNKKIMNSLDHVLICVQLHMISWHSSEILELLSLRMLSHIYWLLLPSQEEEMPRVKRERQTDKVIS